MNTSITDLPKYIWLSTPNPTHTSFQLVWVCGICFRNIKFSLIITTLNSGAASHYIIMAKSCKSLYMRFLYNTEYNFTDTGSLNVIIHICWSHKLTLLVISYFSLYIKYYFFFFHIVFLFTLACIVLVHFPFMRASFVIDRETS